MAGRFDGFQRSSIVLVGSLWLCGCRRWLYEWLDISVMVWLGSNLVNGSNGGFRRAGLSCS